MVDYLPYTDRAPMNDRIRIRRDRTTQSIAVKLWLCCFITSGRVIGGSQFQNGELQHYVEKLRKRLHGE